MAVIQEQELTISVSPQLNVSAILQCPTSSRVLFLFAHGAGAGMRHPFMGALADELAERKVGTLRYQFPYMEQRSKRPDPPALCHATVRAAAREAARLLPGTPLFAGGKSFGGRMTSQAQALAPITDVRGLVFVGFPLHSAKHPAVERAAHLQDVHVPMLFLQGTRDDLADLSLLTPLLDDLGARATLKSVDRADHSFHVQKKSGRTDAEVLTSLADVIAQWCGTRV